MNRTERLEKPRDLILPHHPKSAALPISDKDSTRSSKSRRSQHTSPVSANSTKHNHNSITNWLNALKLKRSQHKQQQQQQQHQQPIQQLGASLSSGEHSRSSSFRSNGSNTSSNSKFKQGGNTTFSICRALRRSVPKRLKHKSKSDNCLYKIDANVSGLDGRHLSYHDLRHHLVRSQISQDSDSSGGSSACGPVNNSHTNRFTRKVFDLTNAISARVHPSSAQNQGLHSKSRLKKTRSLEKDFPFRVVQPNPNRAWHHRVEEECKRRTRSLERNHRYLVTLDSSCSYSREVGSTQVNLDLHNLSNRSVHFPSLHTVPNIINPREEVDIRNRYQPDPTYKPPARALPTPVKPTTGGNINRSTRSNKTGKNRSGRHHIHTCSKHSIPIRPATTMSAATSIVNKPARGWLHPDHLFAQDGVNYAVRYIGSLEVNTSMKVLDFDTRSSIAKECINRICEASGLKSTDKNRRVDPKIASMLGQTPCMDKAGVNVQLTIMVLWLKLSDLDSGEAIFVHDMPNISFASGGDAETLDYVAYVAKDKNNVRSCYVLECGGGLAQEVITTIGQAFELRFKQFLKRTPGTISPPSSQGPKPPHPSRQTSSSMSIRTSNQDEVEYYNDLPGKRPPPPPLISPAQAVKEWHKKESAISNLIDFNTDIPECVNDGVIQIHNAFQHSSSSSASSSPKKLSSNMSPRDPFDMSPFATQPPCGGIPSPVSKKAPNSFFHSNDKLLSQLLKEDWFHGPVSRQEAENLLQLDGDFLVRESQGSRGQYVLTGMQNSSKKHLLLVDPEGIVRTKDRAFESVSHLIAHHRDNNLPIISAESALRLKRAVVKRH
eukprot:TCALIF_02275-PA protein Name:"Similar to Shc1 SHC-transforming protein 1 (Rattus norvegicus)" AED:0.07 eAED:0.07 QI:0/0.9/0.90/0.90/0.9/0.90/11/250/830